MRISEVRAWVRWRDQRAVDACRDDPENVPATLTIWPDSVMPDMPRVSSERGSGFTQPVPRTTEDQRRPTIDEALRTARISAVRIVSSEPKKIDAAYWLVHSVENESGLLFSEKEVRRAWPPLDCAAAPGSPGRGRRKGVGSYEAKDAPLLVEMRRMIVAGEVTSTYAAATALLSEAFGRGSDDAKRKRLVDRYVRTYGRN